MEAYKLYHHIKSGHKEVLKIADQVIHNFERNYGPCILPGYDSLSKLYAIISSGYGDLLWPFLENLNYSYSAELQTVFATIDSLLRNNMSVMHSHNWTCFYSIENLRKLQGSYVLDTKERTMIIIPLTEYGENRNILKYAKRRGYYGLCHNAVEQFIKENVEYQAVTSLMPHQFGRKHYHSYAKKDGKIFDFSHNIYMDEETYQQIMKPIPLNEIYGYELESEERKLGSDELGPEKCLLMRLAVAKQRRG